jgi:hypothetical protein
MSLRRRTLTASAAALAAGLALVTPMIAPASAESTPSGARKLDASVLAPYQVAVRGGTTWWTDGFAGTITRLNKNGKRVIAHVNGEIAGVAVSGTRLAYTSSPNNSFQRLTIRRPGLHAITANLKAYENNHNPDGNKTYGIISGGNACARDFFRNATGAPPRYTGIKDSHPYQVEALPGGSWAVAEAAGNAILKVNSAGRISTIAVLPRQAVTFTQRMADALGAPDCVVGVKYGFEPVPTDVERDSHGNLWVSLLPGGPEDPSLGARGAVYKITPGGRVIRVSKGYLGATNLAVTPAGKVYVAELFKNRISTIRRGHIVTVREIRSPVSVEATKTHLFIGQLAKMNDTGDVTGPGGVYKVPR